MICSECTCWATASDIQIFQIRQFNGKRCSHFCRVWRFHLHFPLAVSHSFISRRVCCDDVCLCACHTPNQTVYSPKFKMLYIHKYKQWNNWMDTKVRIWHTRKMFVSHKFTVGAEQKSNLGFNRLLLDLFVHILLSKITWTWTAFAAQNVSYAFVRTCVFRSVCAPHKNQLIFTFLNIFSMNGL